MKFTVHLTKEDFWKLNKYVMFNLPKYKVPMLLSMLFIPVFCIIIAKLSGSDWLFSIVVGLIIGVLGDFFFVYRIKSRTMKMVSTHDGIIGDHVIEVHESGFYDSTTHSESKCSWSGIHELRQDQDNIYIFVNELQATIVPKRSFTDPAEEQEFIKLVQQYSQKPFV